MSKNKIIEYLEKHKNEMDKTFIIMICELVLFTNFDYTQLKKLLQGSYFIIKDDGFFYKRWKKYLKNDCIFKRISSHYSCKISYRIGKNKIYNCNGDVNKNYDCLIGNICIDNNHKKCDTWFQFEKTRVDGITNKVKHIIDFIEHMIHGKNIGPFGKSIHTQDNPIILKLV